jgi:sugar lactone lactonase YvrE
MRDKRSKISARRGLDFNAHRFHGRALRLLAGIGVLILAQAASVSASGPKVDKRGLWVPNAENGTIVEYTAAQRATSGSPVPELTNSSSVLNFPAALVFDRSGNMWVVNTDAPSVVEFSAKQLKQLGSVPDPAPAVTITSSVLSNPLADFDRKGNLWVSDLGVDEIFEFSRKQLKTGGDLTPAVTITSPDLNGARNLAFDNKGNLWISNDQSDQIEEFAKKGLAKGGALTPAVTLSDDGAGSLTECTGIAFDKKHNLWVADTGANRIVEFPRSALKVSGSPVPAVIIGANGGSLSLPIGVGFDHSQNLWVSNFANSTVVEFSPAQLATSGNPVPMVKISATSGSLSGPEQFSFGRSIQ